MTPTKLSKSVGKNIQVLRRIKGMSGHELGSRIDLSGAQVYMYERGRSAKLSTLEKIAKQLEVPVTKLMEPEAWKTL